MTTLPSIVVVDDAVEVRTLVRTSLRLSGALDVVGEGSTGQEAVELAGRLRPTLMLLDVSMPGMDGLEALPMIRSASPDTRVVMYSGFSADGFAERTLELGATAYFEKSTALDTLADDLVALLGPIDAGPSAPLVVAARTVRPEAVEPVLREHLERFREVFEDAAIGMATMTLSGHVVRANPSLARLIDEPVSTLVAASYAELAGDDVVAVTRAIDKVATGDRDVIQLEHSVRSDPERRLLTTLSAVRDVAGHPLYLFLQVQDVSAQREVEEQLRRSEQRFKLLVEAVQDYAIFMLDPDGHIVSWNTGAQRIKGWAAAEIVGRHFRVFYPPERQADHHPEHELALAVRDGHYEEEGWRVRRDGSEFWAQVTITALRDEDQELVGFAKVTRDITERLSAQQAQDKSAEAIAAANVRLSDAADDQAHFLAVTAHELRSPVGVVAGSADLLVTHRHHLSPDEISELVEGIASAAGRLRRLVDDLLTAARIHGAATEFHPQPLELRAHLMRTVRLMGRALDLEVRLLDVPDVHLNADPDRLAQMLENLLSNAAKHGAAPATVAVSCSGATVEIAVLDSGAGVDESMRERLFQRFATSGQGGTGLGLSIVRELARAHEGDAFYRPQDGAFVITLPVAGPS